MVARRAHARARCAALPPRVLRTWAPRLAIAVAVKMGIAVYMGASGAGIALEDCLGGACLVPSTWRVPDVLRVVVCLLPQMVFCYLACDALPTGLEREGAMVMPRFRTRASWAWGRVLCLVAFAALFSLLGDALTLGALCVTGPFGEAASRAAAIIPAAALEALLLALLAILMGLVALRLDSVIGFALVAGLHAGTLVCLALTPEGLARTLAPWVPSTWGVPAWSGVLAGQSSLWDGAWEMATVRSAACLLVLTVAAAVLLVRCVRRCDML